MSAGQDLLDLPAETVAVIRAAGWWRALLAIPLVLLAACPVLLLMAPLAVLANELDRGLPRVGVWGGALQWEPLTRSVVLVGTAIVVSLLVGSGVAFFDAARTVTEAFGRAAVRLPALVLFYLGPCALLVIALDVETPGVVCITDDRAYRGIIDGVMRIGSLAMFLAASPFAALAPVFIIRGQGAVSALRASREAARGHKALGLATLVVPGLLVLGGVLSLISVLELRRTAAATGEAGIVGAFVVLYGGLLVAPFFTAALKVAAHRVATRTTQDDKPEIPQRD